MTRKNRMQSITNCCAGILPIAGTNEARIQRPDTGTCKSLNPADFGYTYKWEKHQDPEISGVIPPIDIVKPC